MSITKHVPYKTIVRRLYEVEFIQREKCLELLQIPDRDEKSGVRLVQKRWQIGAQQQRRTKIIKFDGLVDDALYAFEQEMINEEKIQYLLSLVRKTVEEFMPQQEKVIYNSLSMITLIPVVYMILQL